MSSDEEEEGLTFKEKTHPPTSGNVVVKREEKGTLKREPVNGNNNVCNHTNHPLIIIIAQSLNKLCPFSLMLYACIIVGNFEGTVFCIFLLIGKLFAFIVHRGSKIESAQNNHASRG